MVNAAVMLMKDVSFFSLYVLIGLQARSLEAIHKEAINSIQFFWSGGSYPPPGQDPSFKRPLELPSSVPLSSAQAAS